MAKRTRQTKPKCVKGTACGYSCISGKLTCSSRILERDAAALVKTATGAPADVYVLPSTVGTAKPELRNESLLTDAERAEATRLFAELIDKAEIRINISSQNLLSVLADGRFKTTWETGTSNGEGLNTTRRETESRVLGVPSNTPDSERPVYGTISDPGKEGGGLAYGELEVVVKRSTRDRTTFTVEDSFMSFADTNPSSPSLTVASRVTEPRVTDTFPDSYYRRIQTGSIEKINQFRLDTYMEAQIHGGLTVSDIDFVRVRPDTPIELIQALSKAGIKTGQARPYGY